MSVMHRANGSVLLRSRTTGRPGTTALPGQRVVTSEGVVRTVAFVRNGTAFVYGPRGLPEPATVRYDALGGEAGEAGLAA
jgi:hypothetical protein